MSTLVAKQRTVKIGDFTVNRLGYGAMRLTGSGIWGEPEDREGAKEVLKRATQLGVNFIDTADAYGPEASENIIHDALHPYQDVVIATKGGLTRGGPGQWTPKGNPEYLILACEQSLRRLDLPSIDVYQLHSPDPNVEYKESIQALAQLQNEGKIRHIGVSNVSLDQLKQALEMVDVVSVQNHYNFQHRSDSEDVLRFCEENDIAFIPYFPIGGGMESFNESKLGEIAAKYDASSRQIALAWLLARSPVMLPIPGTSSIEHLEENMDSMQIDLDDEDMTTIEEMSDL